MLPLLQPFLNQPLRRVLYYRAPYDANSDLNWSGAHDVGQGVDLAFDTGYFFITWDNAAEEEITVQMGRMVDWLREGIFEDASEHPDWQGMIGEPLIDLELLPNEMALRLGGREVFIVTAEVDRETPEIIDVMSDNLVVFFSRKRRDAFFAQYPHVDLTAGEKEETTSKGGF